MSLAPTIGGGRLRDRITRENVFPRVRYGLVLALAIGATIAFIVFLVTAFQWRDKPFFGAMLTSTLVVNGGQPTTDDVWIGLEAGLSARDQIVEVNGVSTRATGGNYGAARERFNEVMDSLSVGDRITVTAVTPSGNQKTFTYNVSQFPTGDFLVFFGIPFVSGLIALAAGWIVFIARPRQNGLYLIVSVIFLTSILMGGIFDAGSTQALVSVWLFTSALLGGLLITLGMIFPTRLSYVYRHSNFIYIPPVFSFIIGVIAVTNYFNPTSAGGVMLSNQIAIGTTLIGGLAFAILMALQRQRSTSPITRDQSAIMLLGMVMAAVPGLLWIVGQVIQQLDPSFALPLNLEASQPFLLAPVISLAYAVLRYNVFDSDLLLSRSITYIILMTTLVIGYFLLILGASLIATDIVPDNPILIALTLFFVSLLFIPVRGRLEDRVNQIYFRKRRNYQEKLEEFSEMLGRINDIDEIVEEFRRLVREALSPSSIFVYLPSSRSDDFIAFGKPYPETNIRFNPNQGVGAYVRSSAGPIIYLQPDKPYPPELLIDRTRLMVLRPLIVAGLIGKDRLNGMITIGGPRSGAGYYGYEELRFINAIISQLSVAVERIQVIDSLQDSINELNVLSQVGQAVNFTIEFDDLLELIYAQTLRLIDFKFFYIALYEEATQQLYFAFYLENDDRYEDRENRRWMMGKDPFSAVIRSGQPLRLADYELAITEGDYSTVFERSKIKAWMGVPLVAQTSTLGVLAVGKDGASGIESFTSDQLKVFNNIGALAASSIDKARLFSEVNRRAKQLAALNDISQKLGAAESEDIESLLELITSSAVDILFAEAGSLLLMVDDERKELEFRVAVGGTGASLLGKRIPSDRGLVGEVIRSGQPQISNDTRQDQRWEGELTESGFTTSSILAVPLIAKDVTVGVLEVLNKRDGTAFQREEVELLTTFAGQAAIAIENARLFQMTGSQLNQRLEELQTLEQIDRELARELDISRVAEITIKWAVANSGAVAAALGEVYEPSNTLLIRAKYGYRDDDYPEGAENNRWPLDKGIVKRVMRTALPDLADVTIDPDYIPSLRDATSQITVPMMSGDEINAILILETNNKTPFNLLDLEFVKRLAERASIALSNAQLYEGIKSAAETKSEFVGFAAHELKNPLTSIKGYAAALLGEYSKAMSEEMRSQALDVIRNNAERMQSIIDDMRDIAKSDAGKFDMNLKPITVLPVVVSTLMTFEQQIEQKQQSIVNNVSENLPEIYGDQAKLIQVMTNLVSNAYKYTPEGGTITIDAKVVRNFRDSNGKPYGDVVHISVSDTGIGMSEEDLNRIFREDYFRSENRLAREQKGTGLGMIITQRIIEGHHGRIWVESELNVGTTFQFVVPVVATIVKSESIEDDTDSALSSRRMLRANIRATQTTSTIASDGETEASTEASPESESTSETEPASD